MLEKRLQTSAVELTARKPSQIPGPGNLLATQGMVPNYAACAIVSSLHRLGMRNSPSFVSDIFRRKNCPITMDNGIGLSLQLNVFRLEWIG